MTGKFFDSNSKHIAGAEYDGETKLLTVYFRNAVRYRWEGIPENIWEEFEMSLSRGAYLHFSIEATFGKGRKVINEEEENSIETQA